MLVLPSKALMFFLILKQANYYQDWRMLRVWKTCHSKHTHQTSTCVEHVILVPVVHSVIIPGVTPRVANEQSHIRTVYYISAARKA